MPITEKQLRETKTPFYIVADCRSGKRKGLPSKQKPSKVLGYTINDPLGVGGTHWDNNPCVHFEKGGWLLIIDFMKNHSIVEAI